MYTIIQLHSLNIAQSVFSDIYSGDVAPAIVSDVQCNGGEEQLVDCSSRSLDGSTSCAAHSGLLELFVEVME